MPPKQWYLHRSPTFDEGTAGAQTVKSVTPVIPTGKNRKKPSRSLETHRPRTQLHPRRRKAHSILPASRGSLDLDFETGGRGEKTPGVGRVPWWLGAFLVRWSGGAVDAGRIRDGRWTHPIWASPWNSHGFMRGLRSCRISSCTSERVGGHPL